MTYNHPKLVRRKLLLALYNRYLKDPLEMLSPEDVLSESGIAREDLLANIHYLHDRGLVELMVGYNPPLFAAARITADGIDLIENQFEFNLRFPPEPSELEVNAASIPYLCERLVEEADFSPLDGEKRRTLLRDVQYLRDELSRPVHRWRLYVLESLLDWIDSHFEGIEEGSAVHLPSLCRLRDAIRAQFGSQKM
ncbi:MAG TPA: hypothetical protein PKY35_02005 [Candidatus Hydrogenedentes bacterium]|nr:hypothetical protein [Candidatus Hydrogenedentota bacterium]HOL75776.1 hypothetical protein [Candidatus Hydrogenedentota bacterium]HPO84230.1 hypothetical protein [Candidatus Hydrogenedentota bacterium]